MDRALVRPGELEQFLNTEPFVLQKELNNPGHKRAIPSIAKGSFHFNDVPAAPPAHKERR